LGEKEICVVLVGIGILSEKCRAKKEKKRKKKVKRGR